MAKRFIDTGFLDQKWIRKLSPEKKIFIIYLMLKCDNAGIIELDYDDASFWIGKKVDNIDFLPDKYLISINESGKYFMPKFIEWQYPNFPHSKVHQQEQAKQILVKNGIFDIENQVFILPKGYVSFTQALPNVCANVNVNGNVNGNDNANVNVNANANARKKDCEGKIERRENEFCQRVFEYDPLKYPQSMLEKFCNYWTEKNKSGARMRFELQKTFEISKRLAIWAGNDKDFKKSEKPRVDGYV